MGAVVTIAVYAVLAVVVVAALVALAVLVLPGNEELAPAPADRTPWALPAERAMTGPDVGRLRLPVTLRGYRFAETDAVLDRLGEEIAYRDTVIATLQAELEGRAHASDASDDEAGRGAADGEAAELGETPEETRHESVAEARPQPEVESEPVTQVVGIDDDMEGDLPGDDDLTLAPDGPATAPANDLPDGDPALDEGPDGPPDDPPASRT